MLEALRCILPLVLTLSILFFGACGKPMMEPPIRAQHERIVADLQKLKPQLTLYKYTSGFYPPTGQGLQALVTEPMTSPKPAHWHQLYPALPRDPWGRDYVYRCPGKLHPDKYDLFSAGPDRLPDTADDDWGGP
jgi:general secretion pathway protein G